MPQCESNFLPLKSPAESGAFLFLCGNEGAYASKEVFCMQKISLDTGKQGGNG